MSDMQVAEPKYQVIERYTFEFDTYAIASRRLTSLQCAVQTALSERVVDNYNQ